MLKMNSRARIKVTYLREKNDKTGENLKFYFFMILDYKMFTNANTVSAS